MGRILRRWTSPASRARTEHGSLPEDADLRDLSEEARHHALTADGIRHPDLALRWVSQAGEGTAESEPAVRDPNDPEMALRPRAPGADLRELPLFREPVTDRTAVKYATWRLTEDGKVAFDWIERKALDLAAQGEKRIGSKSLVEQARDKIHVHINNKFTPMIARELVLRHRHLQDHFEFRERTAA